MKFNVLYICIVNSVLVRWGKATLDDDALSHLLPGAVTLVFERQPELNKELNPYTTLVGIRIPDNAFIRELALHCDAPLALTSANKSSTKSSLDVKVMSTDWTFFILCICLFCFGWAIELQNL